MALETANNPTIPSAQVVGNAFVEQYYRILHTSPELVYRFYQDSSVLSRPDATGNMTSVATMQGINEKILFLNFKDYKAEIKTADAQKSLMEGVTVLVTGCLTGKDNLRRKFAQSFFLAPQDNGYFVLNDVFRFVEDNESVDNHKANGIDSGQRVAAIPEPDHCPPDSVMSVEAKKIAAEKETESLEPEKQLSKENEIIEPESHSHRDDISVTVLAASSAAHEDGPKKSYASIVKVVKGSSGITKVYVPTNAGSTTSKKTENHSVAPVAPSPEPGAPEPSSDDGQEISKTREQADGHSIYIRNLPLNVSAGQLEAKFKSFGPIKHDSIQVRYNKQQGYCFGFIEFFSSSSMYSALQASPVTIGGCKAVIEIKRATTRAGIGRGRFPPSRAGFHNDSFRGQGSYSGDRGFGRNEFWGRGEFSGRGRSSSGRGEGYQQVRGKGGRSSVSQQNANSS